MCFLHVISEALSVLLRSLNKKEVLRVSGRIQVPSSPLMTATLLPKYDTSASCARCLEKRKYSIICQTSPVCIVTGILREFVITIQQNFLEAVEEKRELASTLCLGIGHRKCIE